MSTAALGAPRLSRCTHDPDFPAPARHRQPAPGRGGRKIRRAAPPDFTRWFPVGLSGPVPRGIPDAAGTPRRGSFSARAHSGIPQQHLSQSLLARYRPVSIKPRHHQQHLHRRVHRRSVPIQSTPVGHNLALVGRRADLGHSSETRPQIRRGLLGRIRGRDQGDPPHVLAPI